MICALIEECCTDFWLLDCAVQAEIDCPGLGVYHVVTSPPGITPSTVLDGFTIRNGEATGSSGLTDRGGGISINQSNPIIVRCVFVDNAAGNGISALAGGSAIHAFLAGSENQPVRIINCSFINNTSYDTGGAILNQSQAVSGGGNPVGFVQVVNALFQGNSAYRHGGAILAVDSTTTVVNSTFADNHADTDEDDDGSGGGIHGRNAEFLIVNSIF